MPIVAMVDNICVFLYICDAAPSSSSNYYSSPDEYEFQRDLPEMIPYAANGNTRMNEENPIELFRALGYQSSKRVVLGDS